MRLLDSEPALPFGEGELDAHNSGGEHAIRYSEIEARYNLLRRSELVPLAKPGTGITDIAGNELQDMIFGDKHEVIIVQQEIPHDDIDPVLAGVAISRRKKTGKHATRMTVKELVVNPELRRRHIASYMLGRLTQNMISTEMSVATNKFTPEGWFVDGLKAAGFHHNTRNGSPSLWLPGTESHSRGDIKSPAFVSGVQKNMIDGWNGFWRFSPEDDTQLRVYREGSLAGIVRQVEGTDNYDHSIRRMVADFTISDAGDVLVGKVEDRTEKEAMIALLNNYELLDGAA